MESVSLHPVPHQRVRIQDNFWAPRQALNSSKTLPAIYEQLKITGRLDALNLQWKPGDPNPPHVFWESDIAKWIEAVFLSQATIPNDSLTAKAEEVISLLLAAQQPDGYLNVYYTVVEPGRRWTNLRD